MIGNGDTIRVWCDPWLGEERLRIPLMKNIFVNIDLKVCDLLLRNSGSWNLPMLRDLFFQPDIDTIIRNKPVASQNDYWIWKHNIDGVYSVKSGTGKQIRSSIIISFKK